MSILIDIGLSILDKILPWGLKKMLPLVYVKPKKLTITTSEWESRLSFFVFNRSKNPLFDVYLLITSETGGFENIKVAKNHPRDAFEVTVGNVILNYEYVRFDLINGNEKKLIMLKIAQIDENSKLTFEIQADIETKIDLKILEYNKDQSKILIQDGKAAIPFTPPEKLKSKKLKLHSQSMNMRRKS